MGSQIYGDSVVVTKQPTVSSAATAYAVNDVVGGLQTLPCGHGAFSTFSAGSPRNAAAVFLQSITITEQQVQKPELDIYFFDAPVTAPADNAAMDITDANMSDSCIGVVNVPSSAFKSGVSNACATKLNIGLLMQPLTSGTIWALPVTRTAVTMTVASSLVFKYAFSRDL